jgi:uncharacterized DUF497 family protein
VPLRFAIPLFEDPYLVQLVSKARSDEVRYIAVGDVGGRVLACVFTLRGARKRLISLRAARRSERRVYTAQVEKGRG